MDLSLSKLILRDGTVYWLCVLSGGFADDFYKDFVLQRSHYLGREPGYRRAVALPLAVYLHVSKRSLFAALRLH